MAAKRIFAECTGQSFEDVLQQPFFDVVKAVENCPDLFSISYVPDGRAGIDEMKCVLGVGEFASQVLRVPPRRWRFRANGPVRKKTPTTRLPRQPSAPKEPWCVSRA
jgi:hypothetical protein